MPLPNWSPPSWENNRKLTDKHIWSCCPTQAGSKDTKSAVSIFPFVKFWVPSNILSLVAVCLWAAGSLSQSVFKSFLGGLDTCTRAHTETNTHAPTQTGIYGYTERCGGLECLKKTSDCVGASLRGSTSSFLKQAERRLQRGTREREGRLRTHGSTSNDHRDTPFYLHDHSRWNRPCQKPFLLLPWKPSRTFYLSRVMQRKKQGKAGAANHQYTSESSFLKYIFPGPL